MHILFIVRADLEDAGHAPPPPPHVKSMYHTASASVVIPVVFQLYYDELTEASSPHRPFTRDTTRYLLGTRNISQISRLDFMLYLMPKPGSTPGNTLYVNYLMCCTVLKQLLFIFSNLQINILS